MASRKASGPPAGSERAVDLGRILAHEGPHCLELGAEQNREIELQQTALAFILVEDVAEVAEPGFEAHDPLFAQRVDRRVRNLAKVLAEEVVQGRCCSERTANGVSSPIEPTASFASSTMGCRISSRSSMVRPAARWRRRSASPSYIDRLDASRLHDVVDDGDALNPFPNGRWPASQSLSSVSR